MTVERGAAEPTLQVTFSELCDLVTAWAGSPQGLPAGVVRVAVRVAEQYPERLEEFWGAFGHRWPDVRFHLEQQGSLPATPRAS